MKADLRIVAIHRVSAESLKALEERFGDSHKSYVLYTREYKPVHEAIWHTAYIKDAYGRNQRLDWEHPVSVDEETYHPRDEYLLEIESGGFIHSFWPGMEMEIK